MDQYTVDMIELSKLIGAEVHGLLDKLERIAPLFDCILKLECDTSREAVLLLAGYAVVFSTMHTKEHSIKPLIQLLPEVEQLITYLALQREKEDNESR